MTDWVGIKGVLLDADGTLWDTSAAMDAAGAAAARSVWPSLTDADATAVGVRFRSDPTGVFRRFVAGAHTFDEMRALRLGDVADRFDLPMDEGSSPAFEAAFGRVFDATLRAFADASGLLAWLAERGIPVRVLTNSAQAYTVGKVSATGLSQLIGAVCSRDCVGVGKPAPEPFHHACAQMGLAPEHVAYVGDEWTSDVIGSREAGLSPVWLVRGPGEAAGEVLSMTERREVAARYGIPVIASLADLPTLFGPEVTTDLGVGGAAR